MLSLFAPKEPEEFWDGKVRDLGGVEKIQAPKLQGPARNGVMRRSL